MIDDTIYFDPLTGRTSDKLIPGKIECLKCKKMFEVDFAKKLPRYCPACRAKFGGNQQRHNQKAAAKKKQKKDR